MANVIHVGPRVRRMHQTWEQFLADIQTGVPLVWEQAGNAAHSLTNPPMHQWDLSLGWDGAVELAHGKRAWPEGQQAIEYEAQKLAARAVATSTGTVYVPDTEGQAFDVGAVVAGAPEPWVRQEPSRIGVGERTPVLLLWTLNAACKVKASQLANHAKTIAAACIVLETLGTPVEVWACESVDNDRLGTPDYAAFHHSIIVKQSTYPLDIRRLSIVAHPAFFRRLCFRAIEQMADTPELAGVFSGNYGWPCPTSPSDYAAPASAIIVPSVMEPAGAARVLRDIVRTRTGVQI